MRDEGRFGERSPTGADLAELIRESVETGRLLKVRKGFSTTYRLPEPEAQPEPVAGAGESDRETEVDPGVVREAPTADPR